jgi:uncharacterized membrane protein YfcA
MVLSFHEIKIVNEILWLPAKVINSFVSSQKIKKLRVKPSVRTLWRHNRWVKRETVLPPDDQRGLNWKGATMNEMILWLAIFLVAFLYSSVGHGGASGYLAILTLYGFSPPEVKSSALALNMLVSAMAFYSYFRSQHTDLRKLLPFLAGSVPLSFAGSLIQTNVHIYKLLLAVVLLIAVLRMVLQVRQKEYLVKDIPFVWAVIAGILIGFVSGLVGIGGGILLSPLLIFLRWASIRDTACLAALFILINSMTGLTGMLVQQSLHSLILMPTVLAAFSGGWLGSWLGSRFFPVRTLKLTLTVVLFIAGLKLMIG